MSKNFKYNSIDLLYIFIFLLHLSNGTELEIKKKTKNEHK